MRHVVRVLRSADAAGADLAPGPTLAALPEAAERLTAVGLPVELYLPDDLPPLTPQVDLAAVRIAQESLTNVLVHAKATRAVVQVLVEPGMLVVDVQDDGPGGPAEPGRGRPGGHGLVGMRERAAACGGELTIGRSPLGGWEVTARLPLDGRPVRTLTTEDA
jgi:signal transduction histidine kinase